tara:strand:+ start:658 stop:1905 length:1248 start_codon:yes stop_codon:yes gene_type:complete
MPNVSVELHPAQMQIFNSKARFKIAACGRRFGKSHLAAWTLLIKGLQSPDKDIFYIAPTFQQAKDIMWSVLKDIGKDLIKSTHENTATITLINDRKIYLKGSDRPDTLRGVGLRYVVLDEYAFMKPSVWELIIRPTLADVKGEALFIGTPEGRNHFFDLYCEAKKDDEWEAFSFNSTDNPLIDPKEIEVARRTMSTQAFRQEFEASFESFSGGIFQEDWFIEDEEPADGHYVIAVDPAGFEQVSKERGSKGSKLDETAIAIVKISGDSWWVKDILHGRWNIKKTAERILNTAIATQANTVGIEAGALKNAIMPYLEDQMRINNRWVVISEVTHGGKKKTDRITWSLQGRMEHGKISFNSKRDWKDFVDQMTAFPSPQVHDDQLDALAYIDQVSVADFANSIDIDEWEPTDEHAGY